MPFSPKKLLAQANLHHIGRKYSENLIQHWVVGFGWIKSLDRQFSYFGPLDKFLLEFFQGKDKMRRMQKSGEKLIV